jgi:hypothetical protein
MVSIGVIYGVRIDKEYALVKRVILARYKSRLALMLIGGLC